MKEEIKKEIQAVGVEIQKGIMELGEEVYQKELVCFLKGMDFAKLGYAINGQHWESAIMCTKRMLKTVTRLHIHCMQQLLQQINQAVISKKDKEAKQILALIVQKRVVLLKIIK